MSIIEQIKAEIDKLYGEYKYKFHQCGDQYHLGLIDGLDMAERVLDSLESGKPVPNDLEEAAKEYAKTTFKKPYSDNPDEEVTIVEPDKYAGFIAGAKWDKEQMMSNAVEGTVYGNGVYTWVAGDIPSQFKYGDKVRVIVLPKED